MTDAPIPRLQFGFSEAAEALGIPVSTLELECRRGRGPKFYKIGRRKYTTIKLIEDWQNYKISEIEE